MTNYTVGDFLIRIKNAMLAGRREVEFDNVKFINEISKALKKLGFIDSINKTKDGFSVTLAYHKKRPLIKDLKLMSKPGLRVYKSVDELKEKRGFSVYVLSTPKGVMGSKEAIKKNVGGEVIVEIW